MIKIIYHSGAMGTPDCIQNTITACNNSPPGEMFNT